MRKRTRLNRERRALPPSAPAQAPLSVLTLSPEQIDQMTKLATLDAYQREALEGWMMFYGYSFEVAYRTVTRDGSFPERWASPARRRA